MSSLEIQIPAVFLIIILDLKSFWFYAKPNGKLWDWANHLELNIEVSKNQMLKLRNTNIDSPMVLASLRLTFPLSSFGIWFWPINLAGCLERGKWKEVFVSVKKMARIFYLLIYGFNFAFHPLLIIWYLLIAPKYKIMMKFCVISRFLWFLKEN